MRCPLQHYQQQLELDEVWTEADRLQRWERRLAWEQLGEEERPLRYRELAARNALGALGLGGGFWGRRFGGLDLDLSYLRSVPIRRGLLRLLTVRGSRVIPVRYRARLLYLRKDAEIFHVLVQISPVATLLTLPVADLALLTRSFQRRCSTFNLRSGSPKGAGCTNKSFAIGSGLPSSEVHT